MGAPVWEQHLQIEDALPAAPYGSAGALAASIWGPPVAGGDDLNVPNF
jgi:hypothetical protein